MLLNVGRLDGAFSFRGIWWRGIEVVMWWYGGATDRPCVVDPLIWITGTYTWHAAKIWDCWLHLWSVQWLVGWMVDCVYATKFLQPESQSANQFNKLFVFCLFLLLLQLNCIFWNTFSFFSSQSETRNWVKFITMSDKSNRNWVKSKKRTSQ